MTFTCVHVRLGAVAGLQDEGRCFLVCRADHVRRLAGFFAPAFTGAHSNRGGGWMPKYILDFVAEDGTAQTVLVSDQCKWFSGRGDWPLHPAFESVLRELIDE
jgi:hypothetical protein